MTWVDVPNAVPPSPRKCFAVARILRLVRQVVALEPVDARRPKPADQVGVLAISLVGPTPPDVLGHRDHRGKGPADACGGRLGGRHAADVADQVRVTGGTESDVVGEHGRAGHV